MAQATQNTVAGNGSGKWANAQTADGSLYVWIPRYTYKITSGEHGSGESWNSLDSKGSNKIEIKFSNVVSDNTNDGYMLHPAFAFGKDDLEGIWVAKYEASQGTTTSEVDKPTASSYVLQSKPDERSWTDISASLKYEYAYNAFRSADSHMMRNSEWGAVAYLTNAIGRIPYINNASNGYTGQSGASQDETSSYSGTSWNTTPGVKASTTHNVYGIYDMSGGNYEVVAAYWPKTYSESSLANDVSNKKYAGSLYANRNTKYVEVYDAPYISRVKGDAIYETSGGHDRGAMSSDGSLSWDDDESYTGSSYNNESAIWIRGGGYSDGSRAGLFAFKLYSGNNYNAFRAVLAIMP